MGDQNGVVVFGSIQKLGDGTSVLVCLCVLSFELLFKFISPKILPLHCQIYLFTIFAFES